MITVIYSTHKDQTYNRKFKEHLEKTIDLKEFQILEYQNNNEYSLAEIYNKGINESKYNIVVCCHNDIKLESGWGKKLLKAFNDNPDYGIIGKAGSCYFPESGVYWEKMFETMVGQVYHHPEGGKKFLSRYSAKLSTIIPVVTIDGVFISFDKTKIKHTFDETIGKFHFYDHCFCLPNFLDGVKIGVTCSFDLTHQSVGQPNEEFNTTKILFLQKYGKDLPLDIKPESIQYEQLNIKSTKNEKVGVIIPTDNPERLFVCLSSIQNFTLDKDVEFFVAYHGSSDEDKKRIQYFADNNKRNPIHLIECENSNVGRIYNNVVKNHVSQDITYLLFCDENIVLLNDVIGGMVDVFKKNPSAGTVGCRIHHEDNTVQHNGMISLYHREQKKFNVINIGESSYYNYVPYLNKVSGNRTLIMIRKNVFEKCGYFNENYISCFEDVELNYKCLLLNYHNYCDGSLVSYYRQKESDDVDNEKMNFDYKHTLEPFINENFKRLGQYITVI